LLATWAVMAARERSTPAVLGRALEARALADALEDGASRAAVYGALAEVFARARTFDDALALASSAIDSSLRSGAIRLELRARVTLYRVSLELGRTHQALVHLRSICERAATADDLEMLLFGLSSASDMAADAGDAAWLDELDAALETVGDSADVYVEALGASLADALARSRALRSAGRARFDEALRHIDALGPAAAPRRRARAGEAALYAAAAGDAARARDERLRGRRLLEGDGDDGSPDALFTRLFLALAAILGDEPAECDEHLALLEARADRIALPHISFVRAARAAAEYAANRTARSRLTDATSALSRSGLGGFAALIDGLPIRPAVVVPSSALTATEVRVLELLCDGLTSREIAARLERSVLTIDSHAKTIVRKLRCTGGRREAVEMARSGRIAGFAARQGKVAG
jgi:DNA-binding CsgD family transcriptional regulator